ncbi:MAG: phosphoadenosine phosphosulfate reductase family protein [Oscillospiraceae bacterium]|nr:phosphoadenosine phosphosulfate reductase family protein [Oscillospiraceae bacterium]
MQALPLDMKVRLTQDRIREWYNYWGGQVYISFSGGKDSTVLLDIARKMYPDIEAVFVNTGLEYPEIRQFVMGFENVTILQPKKSFYEILSAYGYPIVSKMISHNVSIAKRNPDGIVAKKLFSQTSGIYAMSKWKGLLSERYNVSDQCCAYIKKQPAVEYTKKSGKMPVTAEMACESKSREKRWYESGCNAFDVKHAKSKPMSFWTEQDVLLYIKTNKLPIASVYGEVVYDVEDPQQERFDGYVTHKLKTTGCQRTGCTFCAFGAHLEKDSRFVRLADTHPKLYEYCIGGGEFDESGTWKPNKKGLGMGYVFDRLNELYGKDGKPFIRYKKEGDK